MLQQRIDYLSDLLEDQLDGLLNPSLQYLDSRTITRSELKGLLDDNGKEINLHTGSIPLRRCVFTCQAKMITPFGVRFFCSRQSSQFSKNAESLTGFS